MRKKVLVIPHYFVYIYKKFKKDGREVFFLRSVLLFFIGLPDMPNIFKPILYMPHYIQIISFDTFIS